MVGATRSRRPIIEFARIASNIVDHLPYIFCLERRTRHQKEICRTQKAYKPKVLHGVNWGLWIKLRRYPEGRCRCNKQGVPIGCRFSHEFRACEGAHAGFVFNDKWLFKNTPKPFRNGATKDIGTSSRGIRHYYPHRSDWITIRRALRHGTLRDRKQPS